jgi:UPF0755 protein
MVPLFSKKLINMNKWPRRYLDFFLIALVSISAILLLYVWQLRSEFFVKPYAKPPTRIILAPHSNAHHLITAFEDVQFIHSPRALALLIRLNQLGPKLRAGTYLLEPSDTVWTFIEKIIKGKVLMQRFTIVEGVRWCELEQTLQLSQDFRFLSSSAAQLKDNYDSLEGLLFASTYQYPVGEDILPVLTLAKQELKQRLDDVWLHRDPGLPYQTPYELVIAASIIEKEASDPNERQLISGVIVNRLRLHMPLQMDPIVAYGLPGCSHTQLKGSDVKQDSPFNSYKHRGLPPTPIAMVGMSALMAAAHPTTTTYLYFVAKGNGLHYFSSDYREQINAINQYIRKPHASN